MSRSILTILLLINTGLIFSQTVEEVKPTNPPNNVSGLIVCNGKLFFGGNGVLWTSDGTDAGTSAISSSTLGFMFGVDASGYSSIYNGKLFFGATNGSDGKQLWISDGTNNGTSVFKKLTAANYVGVKMRYFVQYNGKLYFLLDDGTHGLELWVSDGTSAGTQMVSEINPSGNGFDYTNTSAGIIANPSFTVMNNKLYFKANDGVHGLELWVTDGTAGGTKMVADINTNTSSGAFNVTASGRLGLFTVYNNNLYFAANDGVGSGYWLWSSDGTTAGTKKILNKDGFPFLLANNFTVFNNKLYFYGSASVQLTPNNFVTQAGLWCTDGTTAGTTFIKDFNQIIGDNGLSDDTRMGSMRIYNNKLYFAGVETKDTQAHLWASDGTTAGTVLVTKINTSGSSFASATVSNQTFVSNVFESKLYFIADDGKGFEIYSSDGTKAGTLKVNAPTHTFSQQLINTQELVLYNNSLYFMANYLSKSDLWRIKGSATRIENNSTGSLPSEFKLEQNYPNPFNPSTTIKYSIPVAALHATSLSHVTLKVFDELGREVATLVDEFKQPGIYSSQFSSSIYQLSSGIYFYQLKSDNFIDTKKFVLIK